MAVYNNNFTGPAANYEWYQRLNSLDDTYEQELSIMFIDFFGEQINSVSYERLFLVTNVPCTSQTGTVYTAPSVSGQIDVHRLVSFDSSEEIDPTAITLPIPTTNVEFIPPEINEFSSLAEIEEFLESIRGRHMLVFKGWFTFDYENYDVRDNNGDFQYTYDSSRFSHDLNGLGLFTITNVDFDFQTQTVKCEGESFAHTKINDPSFYKEYLLQADRRPMPYYWNVNVAGNYYGYANKFALGFSNAAMLGNYNALDETDIHTHALSYMLTFPWYPGSNTTFGMSASTFGALTQFVDTGGTTTSKNTTQPMFSGAWRSSTEGSNTWWPDNAVSNYSFDEVRDFVNNPIGGTNYRNYYRLANPAYLIRNNQTYGDMLQSYMLQNDSWLLPSNWFISAITTNNNWYNSRGVLLNGTDIRVPQGAWLLQSGKVPDDNIFCDLSRWPTGSASSWTGVDNGHYYPALGYKYYVTPRMLRSSSVSREPADYATYDTVKMWKINLGSDDDVSYESYTPPTQSINTTTSGLASGFWPWTTSDSPSYTYTPHYALTGITFPYTNELPLSDESWFSYGRPILISGVDSTVSESEYWYSSWPLIRPYSDTVWGGACNYDNLPVYRGKLKIFNWIYSSRLNFLNNGSKGPYTLQLPKKPINEVEYNINGITSVSENSLSTSYAYFGNTGVAARILNRVNFNNYNCMYKLVWQMNDDPSLRVGACVYVPLQNQYVKVLVTKKRISFTGASTAELEGIAITETSEMVVAIDVSSISAYYLDTSQGRRLTFEWVSTVNGIDDSVVPIQYTIYYKANNSSTYEEVAVLSYTSNEDMLYDELQSEIEAKLGHSVNLTGSSGQFFVQGSYGNVVSDYEPFTLSQLANPYVIYLNQIELNNQILPLMNGHWFIG